LGWRVSRSTRRSVAVERPFELAIDGGVLRGHRGGEGAPALLLHGGAAVPDYTGGCAEVLDGLFSTIRYTQRGTPPSGGAPPYTVGRHVADAVAVLDAFELPRVWAIGHSWGGQLALHLLVAHPERLLGVLCIDALGADVSVFAAYDESLHRKLSPKQSARIREIEERRRAGDVSEADLLERLALSWPHYFARTERTLPPPERVGVRASIETNRSLAEHFVRRTLARGLPAARLPVLFVHGEDDPMPLGDTATLIPGARVETIPDCGHFPWVEQPEAFRAAVERLLESID
jgi:proline iminopeptidase